MDPILVYGKITVEEVAEALRKTFPEKSIQVSSGKSDRNPPKSLSPNELLVGSLQQDATLKGLSEALREKEKDLKESEESANKAIISIQALHKQQQALFDEFVLLRQRYDEQKTSTVSILWNQCAKYHPDLRQVPPMEDSTTFVENDDVIGSLVVGEALGEGQFATVKSCTMNGSDHEYALKIIKKDRITSFTSLMRVSNEIDNLRQLKSPYVVSVAQVIHTQNMLYIVTEKGGSDLFEFFDEHPDGVPENWAREIIACVLKGVLYCHDQSICHRDLKPENILLSFDPVEEKCIDLKLCDFGLSTKFKTKTLLTDFCGSPGFFAPEMIINGTYYGDKADVWSIGCILLELVLGHEKFCDVWMTAYDYEVLQDKDSFTNTINETVHQLPDHLHFSNDLNDFILSFLEMKPAKRPTVRALAAHSWLKGALDEELSAHRSSRLLSDGRPWSPPGLSPSVSFTVEEGLKDHTVTQEVLRAAYNNLSEKERRQMEEYILHHKHDSNSIHLPPITPATPSIGQAKKILRKGNELANKNFQGSENTNNNNNLMNSFAQDMGSPMAVGKGHQNGSRSPLPSVAEDQAALDLGTESVTHPTTPIDMNKPKLVESQSESLIWN